MDDAVTSDEMGGGDDVRRARRRPGENRVRLLHAGVHEFGYRGYHGAVTAVIAARADVPQPHLYANFATKQELFLVCLAEVRERLLTAHLRAASLDTHGDGAPTPGTDEQPVPGELERFLYQAVAIAGAADDLSLATGVRPALLELRIELGERRFSELIIVGARSLLGGES